MTMKATHQTIGRPGVQSRLLQLLLAATALVLLTAAPSSWADDESGYVRIEEDWTLEVNTPDSERSSPQVATQMAPAFASRYFGLFQLNFRELPDFAEGGLQIHLWRDERNVANKSFGTSKLQSANEVITWTQSMERDGVLLKFKIKSGSSTTWGDLASAQLEVNTLDTRREFLAYDSSYSAQKSGITFGANRVRKLVLTQVRKYKADGKVDIESTPRVVFQEAAMAP